MWIRKPVKWAVPNNESVVRLRQAMKLKIEEFFKDTHREKAPSNKTPALRNVRIWAFGLLVH